MRTVAREVEQRVIIAAAPIKLSRVTASLGLGLRLLPAARIIRDR
jgi:hypothetical protein